MHVLIVEDCEEIGATIEDYLSGRSHTVDRVSDGGAGLQRALSFDYDAIIVDVVMPIMDGLQLTCELRDVAHRNTPILMLSARGTLPDKLNGFRTGADDYLVKPFDLPELEVRLLAITRRADKKRKKILRVGDLEFDPATLHVQRAGTTIKLAPTTLKLLRLLMEASDRVVRRSELERAIWGRDQPDSDSLRTHVAHLRSAIDRSFEKKLLHTMHGIGYRLTNKDFMER